MRSPLLVYLLGVCLLVGKSCNSVRAIYPFKQTIRLRLTLMTFGILFISIIDAALHCLFDVHLLNLEGSPIHVFIFFVCSFCSDRLLL